MSDELLTDAEHEVIDLLARATNLFATEVVGDGPTRDHDVNEWASRIHDLQARVLSHAAARAYPDRYRLLGGTLKSAGVRRSPPVGFLPTTDAG